MSAPDAPEDNSYKIAQLEAQETRRAERRERIAERKEAQRLQNLRQAARRSAYGDVDRYFSSQGLVDDDYTSAIDAVIGDIFATIPRDDTNPAAYFNNIGQRIYEQEQTGTRNRYMRDLDKLFMPNFERDRIADTTDDAILDALLSEQRSDAERILDNMRARKVITDSGYQAGLRDLDRQSPTAKARLTALGDAEIASGRSKLRDIANTARSTASNLNLGTTFDPYSYSQDVDRAFDSWLSGLDTNLRAVLPTDLFATGSLAATAGAGQGAQNTVFNPSALAGIVDEDDDTEDEDENTPESIF